MNKWNKRFSELAEHVSSWSKDESTRVGCIIVNPIDNNPISMGYNGFASKVNEDIKERHIRPLKYLYTVHSEANGIANAAKNGQKTKDCVMYVNFFPCCNCAGLIVNAGIIKIYSPEPDFNHERWGENWKIAYTILNEGGVEIEYI
jgi:dCMP deaminase